MTYRELVASDAVASPLRHEDLGSEWNTHSMVKRLMQNQGPVINFWLISMVCLLLLVLCCFS